MKERYENLDGLRAFAAIGIVLMHVAANGNFKINGFFYDRIISSFTDFTFLFMILSAFSMCCGYYEKFKSGLIDLDDFYKRRYQRIWPYFAILCSIELVVNHSLNSLYEWFADITLAFGLIPNHKIEVVGVGWFLGVIFVFYMVFPFFVFLIANKKRAWFVFIITIIINILCYLRFEYACGRTNFIFCAMFFISGGLIFLYKEKLQEKKNGFFLGALILLIAAIYYSINDSVYTMLVLFSLISIFGIVCKGKIVKFIFCNVVISFIASISMELYLCHMFVYRVIEKCNFLHITGNENINYVLTCVITLCGAITFSFIIKQLIVWIMRKNNKV